VFLGLGAAAVLVSLTITLAMARPVARAADAAALLPFGKPKSPAACSCWPARMSRGTGWREIRKDRNDAIVKRVTTGHSRRATGCSRTRVIVMCSLACFPPRRVVRDADPQANVR